MWEIVKNLRANLDSYRHARKVGRALALHLRREVRRDGLELTSICNSLEIEWRARDVHPWDRDCRPEERRAALVEQTLFDTEAAISRLFEALPFVHVLRVRVLDVGSNAPILGGTVHRSSLAEVRSGLSIGMKLRELGITYHSEGLQFEPLGHEGEVYGRPWASHVPELAVFCRKPKT